MPFLNLYKFICYIIDKSEYSALKIPEDIMSINLKESIKPVSYMKTNAVKMMKYVNEQKSPIIITQNGEAKAVLVDIETYQNTQDAFALMNIIKIAEKDIANGRVRKADDVFKELKRNC